MTCDLDLNVVGPRLNRIVVGPRFDHIVVGPRFERTMAKPRLDRSVVEPRFDHTTVGPSRIEEHYSRRSVTRRYYPEDGIQLKGVQYCITQGTVVERDNYCFINDGGDKVQMIDDQNTKKKLSKGEASSL